MKKPKTSKRKNLFEAATYAYIRKIKKWMYCPACQQGKMTINKKSTVWTCEECGYKLSADEFEDNYVFWFCDECKAYLNNQEGFDKNASRHICKKCGYENDTTFNNLKGICSNCGKTLPDSDATLCADCRQARINKAKKIAKIVAGVTAAVGVAYVAYKSTSGDENQNYTYLPTGDNNEGDWALRCANCGNTDEDTLWDEGDTVYCSKCAHRTSKETGEDDLIECPYCHRMRDRKAAYCRWCNDSMRLPSTPEEFEEIDKCLRDDGF